jgi:hypothetical protein
VWHSYELHIQTVAKGWKLPASASRPEYRGRDPVVLFETRLIPQRLLTEQSEVKPPLETPYQAGSQAAAEARKVAAFRPAPP